MLGLAGGDDEVVDALVCDAEAGADQVNVPLAFTADLDELDCFATLTDLAR